MKLADVPKVPSSLRKLAVLDQVAPSKEPGASVVLMVSDTIRMLIAAAPGSPATTPTVLVGDGANFVASDGRFAVRVTISPAVLTPEEEESFT